MGPRPRLKVDVPRINSSSAASLLYTPTAQPSDNLSRWLLGGIRGLQFCQMSCECAVAAALVGISPPLLLLFPECMTMGKHLRKALWGNFSCRIAAFGPTATKLLQWIATRNDIFPQSFCKDISTFQTHANPDPLPLILLPILRAVSEGKNMDNKVIIQPIPFGCGSVAQVHSLLIQSQPTKSSKYLSRFSSHAKQPLYEDSVLKVLRPFVQEHVVRDLNCLQHLASFISWTAGELGEWLPLSQGLKHFATMILPQTNLNMEAASLQLFRRNFATRRSRRLMKAAGGSIVVPKIHPRLTSAEVLVESRESGFPFDKWMSEAMLEERVGANIALTDEEAVDSGAKLPLFLNRTIGNLGAQMFIKMLLLDNFVHADLHPGNILVRWSLTPRNSRSKWLCSRFTDRKVSHKSYKCSKDPEIVILDAGLVNALTSEDRINFVELFRAVAFGEGWYAGKLILDRSKKADCKDPAGFCVAVADIVRKYVGPPIKSNRGAGFRLLSMRRFWTETFKQFTMRELEIGEALQSILKTSLMFRVELDPAFIGVALATAILEGVGKSLDPDLDLLAVARPFFSLIARDQIYLRVRRYLRFSCSPNNY